MSQAPSERSRPSGNRCSKSCGKPMQGSANGISHGSHPGKNEPLEDQAKLLAVCLARSVGRVLIDPLNLLLEAVPIVLHHHLPAPLVARLPYACLTPDQKFRLASTYFLESRSTVEQSVHRALASSSASKAARAAHLVQHTSRTGAMGSSGGGKKKKGDSGESNDQSWPNGQRRQYR